jgi:threonine dehydrogenase-like Zn-dependent dehydrogenase
MRAAIFQGPKDITVGERPDPVVQAPTDAVVRVVMACVCGSDLWYYRGESDHPVGSIGHEFIGIVEVLGSDVTGIVPGDLVVAPFIYSDMSCPHCRHGSTISCPAGGTFGNGTTDGGQGEAVRVPLAASTLVPVPGHGHSDDVLRSLLTLSDVMSTGHHAAVSAGVQRGDTVAVVGDGAVGLSAVLASKRLGAERIIALSRHAVRQRIAKAFGATDIVDARGEEANDTVLELTAGVGVDAALECVGTQQSIDTAAAIARPGSTIGIVGVPHGGVPFNQTFFRNIGWRGGPAPARIYIPELLEDVLDGTISPGGDPGLRDRPRRHAGGIRGHGRAAGDQVADPGGFAVSAAWSDDQLRRVGDATELQLAPRRGDGSLRNYTTMWVVRVDEDLYVRSAGGPDRPWYRRRDLLPRGHARGNRCRNPTLIASARVPRQ